MRNDLVSIIMLSHNKGRYVAETVRSVIAQTYPNWELIFLDDSSKDDTVAQMMDLMKEGRWQKDNGSIVNRVKVSKSVQMRGFGVSTNSALKEAKGRWIAFLNVGDVWEPEKLEKQIAFMEENHYAFSYTKFSLINEKSGDRGAVVGGMEHISYEEMQKCCWPSYLTVMYDASVVGPMQIRNLGRDNYYALWLNVVKKADCHLLPENLAKLRTKWNLLGRVLFTTKMKWRYECYCKEEGLNSFVALFYTIRNGFYGLMKWFKYVKRV